jgi:large subunit ribosomal protein L25
MDAVLDAVKRNTKGKNEARRLRAAGKIPAVLYGAQKAGDKPAAEPVSFDPKPFMRILHSKSGFNTLITLKMQGVADTRVLVKNVQLDPITHHPLHADLYRVNMDRKITVTVPILLKGDSRGVKQDGGVLDFVHREIEVETCRRTSRTRSKSTSPISASATRCTCAISRPTPRGRRSAIPT